MICTRHDSHLDLARTRWAEPLCEELECKYCKDRPETPEQCPEGPCKTCPYLDTYLGRKKLKGIVALINKHKVAKKLIQARLLKSKNDHTKKRLVVTCRFSNEVVVEIDGGRVSSEVRPQGARGIHPVIKAACWWVDYLEDLPPSEELAAPSNRAREQARKLELSGHWRELKWPLV